MVAAAGQTEFFVERLQPEDVDEMALVYTHAWLSTFDNPPYNLDPRVKQDWVNGNSSDAALEAIRSATTQDIETAERVWFVAKDRRLDSIVGMARPWRADEEGQQRVGALYVHNDLHGKGVATMLMERVIEWSDPTRPLFLMVATQNERARRFYNKFGFEQASAEIRIFYGSIPHIKMSRKGDKQ